MSRANELRQALDGPPGVLDRYFEVHSENDIKADIKALIGDADSRREHFAAMAMQGILSSGERVVDVRHALERLVEAVGDFKFWVGENPGQAMPEKLSDKLYGARDFASFHFRCGQPDSVAPEAVKHADALIAELSK
jgi:hypothetical protein